MKFGGGIQTDQKQALDIVDSVLELPPQERLSYLDRTCHEASLRQYVEELVLSYERAEGCLNQPAVIRHAQLLGEMGLEPWLGRRIGRYELVEEIGEGGMGTVYRAVRADAEYRQHVAIKIVRSAFAPKHHLDRFRVERQILANLHHPNIARLLDGGTTPEGLPFLVMDLVAGTPIDEHCDRRRLSVRQRLELFLQVCSAVQYAHQHLVVHRDLKPGNILVTEDGQVHLLDFGIAKILSDDDGKESQLTQLGGRALTPEYAAPEQITSAPITTAADIYALGVMLYELLTGQRPYRLERASPGALEEAILHVDPAVPSRVAVSNTAADARATTVSKLARLLRGDLDTIVIRALQKSPTERYATAEAFGEDVARFLRGGIVLARRDSFAYRALKFARRYRVGIAVTGVLILTLVGGLAATAYEAEVASTQRDMAIQAQLRSLTQTAAGRLAYGDVPGALGIILEVLPRRGVKRSYTAEALNVFEETLAADAQIFAIMGHTDRVLSAVFSPDGQRIVTASYDNTARIWDAETGRQIMPLSGHTDLLHSAQFSPDGRRIVTASADKTARIWDAATGEQLILLSGHALRVMSATFSSDGRRVATASTDKTARIWDATTGRQIMLLGQDAGRFTWAAFSPDGQRLVTASDDKTARIWDAVTSRQTMLLSGHTDRVWSAAFSPDATRILTASEDKSARVWDVETGRQIMPLSGHVDRVNFAAFSPDGRHIVTASDDKTARIWDAATGRELMLLSGHADRVWGAAFSPNGRRVVTASSDRTARIWDAASNRELMTLEGHAGRLWSAAFSPDGGRVVTASYDQTARIWDTATGLELLRLNGHTDPVNFAAFSPDGRRVITASDDKTARIWDAATGRELLLLHGHADRVSSAVFFSNGSRVVTASLDKTARIWDSVTGREIMLLSGHTDRVWFAALSPDDRHIVTTSSDKTVRIWDATTGRELMLFSGHTERVSFAAFSPEGRRVITASDDKTARIWDAATGRELVRLSGHGDRVSSAAFSPDGSRVVTASDDKTARLWDATTGQQLKVLSGHSDRVQSAAFSPDGRRIITASFDQTARIWDARALSLDVQIGWAEAAQFDPLSSTERFQLGLAAAADARQWSADKSDCDQSAAAPYDPDRRDRGVMVDQIVADIAVRVCADSTSSLDRARLIYQHGRALIANANFDLGKRDFEEAVGHGYRSARIDLGMLLSQPAAGTRDLPRAISLYEQAWNDGVTIAAFKLGSLYEHGVNDAHNGKKYVLAPDETQAWAWYHKAAEKGEPNALARFAERGEDAAIFESNAAKRSSYLLESFKYYAAAAERARSEDWPDEAWRNWRYRRASLARLLARAGMMENVAEVFASVHKQYAPRPAIWEQLASFVRVE